MNLWELRQAMESLIPAWVVIPVIAFAVVLIIYGRFIHKPRRRP